MLPTKRILPVLLTVFLLLATLFFLKSPTASPHFHHSETWSPVLPTKSGSSAKGISISYDKTTPPTVGCDDIVRDLQRRLIEAYQQQLKGIRYANIFGYLETENKGDAAIFAAQIALMSMMGITFLEACRFLDRECDYERFTNAVRSHAPHSAVIMAGGGNFNDFYWEDQPARIHMIANLTDVPIRAFPQSVHMTNPKKIKQTLGSFGSHSNLQLAARDQPSFDWLKEKFGDNADSVQPNKVKHLLLPDIAYAWGSRPDFRTNTKKEYDILILSRDDWEISAGNSSSIPFGEGKLDLGGSVGEVSYRKVDWKKTDTPGINEETIIKPDGTTQTLKTETGKVQRAWAKAVEGFEMLGSAEFIITDRLHGHIMSTIIGAPHVLMDSSLHKNINYHDTWTKDCGCTRIADNIEEATTIARLYFEKQQAL